MVNVSDSGMHAGADQVHVSKEVAKFGGDAFGRGGTQGRYGGPLL